MYIAHTNLNRKFPKIWNISTKNSSPTFFEIMTYNLVFMFSRSILRHKMFRMFEFRFFFKTTDHYVLFRVWQKLIGVQDGRQFRKKSKFRKSCSLTFGPKNKTHNLWYEAIISKNVGGDESLILKFKISSNLQLNFTQAM